MRRRRSRRRRRGGSGRARAAPLARRGCRRRRARVSQRRSHAPLSRTRRRRARRVRAPWCVSPRRGAAVRDAIKKCLVIRQTSKPLANSQKGFWRHHFHGTIPLTSHGIPVMTFSFFQHVATCAWFASSLSPRADVRTVHRGLPTVVARRGPWKRVSSHSRGSHARSTASGVGALACTGRAPRARHTRFQRPRSGARRA